MDELTNTTTNENTEEKTLIEVALQIDEDGMTTVSALYEWLGLDSSNYARWCRQNIINNDFAIEGEDYEFLQPAKNGVFVTNDENLKNQGLGGRPTTDYLITAAFAKRLAMMTKSEKGEEARKYFLGCEEGLKISAKFLKQIQEKVDSYQNMILELDNRVICLESGTSVSGGRVSDWVRETSEDVKELADTYGCSPKEMYSRIIERMEQMYGIFFQRYYDEYSARHPKERPVWRLVVVEFYDLQEEFENSYIALGKEIGLYNNQIDDFLDF